MDGLKRFLISLCRSGLLASILIGLPIVTATILILPAPVRADSPAPALIIIEGSYADLQIVRLRVDKLGGQTGHIFPPDAFIARLTAAQAEQVRAWPQVATVTFDPISPLSALSTATSNPAIAIWNSAFHDTAPALGLQATQPFSDDVLIAPDLPPEGGPPVGESGLGIAAIPYGGSYYDTSRYMVGDVVVAMVLPESNGVAEAGTQDWTASEVAGVQSTTVSGMDKWVQAEPYANLTFVYVWADAPPTGGISYTVETDYEAEQHGNFDTDVINSFMTTLGYTSTSSFTNIRNYINDLRDTYDTDWAYLVQARDDSSGCGRASAYLYGPSTTIYDCDLRGGYVVAHETGHIFGAMDEYCPDACPSPISRYGYLQVVNANSQGPSGSDGPGYFDGKGEALSNIMRNSTYTIGPYTRGQIGWRDSDGDGVLDLHDTFPNTTLLTPTVGASVVIGGQANVMSYRGSGNDISLNHIAGISVRINGLTWLPALPLDGQFNEPDESFSLTLPMLPNGVYTIEAQGRNNIDNTERSPAQTPLTITGSPVINAAPFATFQVLPQSGSTATTFQVDAAASADLEGHALQARWDWENDSIWDTGWSATLTAAHSYGTPGTKVIALELKDSLGATVTVTRTVEVAAANTPPTPFFVVENGDNRFGTTSPQFNFDASGSNDAETPATSLEFRWDFDGNGSWDTGWSTSNKTAGHTYTLDSQGKSDGLPRSNHWQVKLQVRDGNSAIAETTRHIWANPYNHTPVSTGFLSSTIAHPAAPVPFDFSLTSDTDIDESWDALLEYRFDWDSDGNWDTDYRTAASWASYQHAQLGNHAVTMQARDRYDATDTVSQSLSIVESPELLANDKLDATAYVNQTVTRTLNITNTGQFSLTFNLEEIVLGVPLTYTLSNSASGPLTYNWVTSWPGAIYTEPGDWVATTGTRDADDEGYIGPVELEAPFPFYGKVYTQVYLAANGYLSFEPPPADFGSGGIPDGAAPNGLISSFWADQNMSIIATDWPTDGIGSLAYNPATAEGSFVAEYSWVGLSGANNWDGNSYEIILKPNGTILMQYQFLSHSPSGPTGIENHDGSQGLTYTDPLTNNLAVAFTPGQTDIPWLSLLATSGSAGADHTTPIEATFDATGLLPGTYTGQLLVHSNDPDAPFSNIPVTFTVIESDLAVAKSVTPLSPAENELITYTVTINNEGDTNATGIIISDTLPVSLTLVSSGTTDGSYNAGSGLWTIDTLNQDNTAVLTIVAEVNSGTRGQTITNTAYFNPPGSFFDSNSGNNQASAAVIVSNVDLAITKTVNTPSPNEGEAITYTVSVVNIGLDSTTGVIISDSLPLSTTFVASDTTQGHYDAGLGQWHAENLTAGQRVTLTVQATVDANTAGQTLTNTAIISASNQHDSDTTNDKAHAVITVSGADLGLTHTTTPAILTPGEIITYTVTLKNYGPDNATGVVVSSILPVEFTLVSSITTQGSYNYNTGQWMVGSLAKNSIVTLTRLLTAAITTSEQAFTVTVNIDASDQPDSYVANNSVSAMLTIEGDNEIYLPLIFKKKSSQ